MRITMSQYHSGALSMHGAATAMFISSIILLCNLPSVMHIWCLASYLRMYVAQHIQPQCQGYPHAFMLTRQKILFFSQKFDQKMSYHNNIVLY